MRQLMDWNSVKTTTGSWSRGTSAAEISFLSIIEQLRARADYIDSSAGALLASDERRIDSGGRTYRQQDYTQQGRIVLRKVLVEGLGHAWSGGDAQYEFNDAAGPDAGRLILDFVTQYHREVHPIASRTPRAQERASEAGGA